MQDSATKTKSARGKNGFGLMIDTPRAELVLIEKHGRGVVVVVKMDLAIERVVACGIR